MLTPLKPRFILDAYKLSAYGAAPLNSSEIRKFCTQAQAEELVKLLPPEAGNPVIVDTLQSDFVGSVCTNYRDDSDASNLKCLSITCAVKVFQRYDPGTGDPIYGYGLVTQNCGEIIADRCERTKLIVSTNGQILWE